MFLPYSIMHTPMQMKYAAKAAHRRRASREDDSSLLDYAQARIWKFAANAACGPRGIGKSNKEEADYV